MAMLNARLSLIEKRFIACTCFQWSNSIEDFNNKDNQSINDLQFNLWRTEVQEITFDQV